jgi:hypothetical protein
VDEAVAFRGVEPLYVSYRHLDTSVTLNNVLAQATVFGGLGKVLRRPNAFVRRARLRATDALPPSDQTDRRTCSWFHTFAGLAIVKM